MNKPLAIIAPQVGAYSETFIRRHMQDLLPGGTVIVTNTVDGSYAGHWSVDCPILALNQVQWGGLNQGMVHFLTRQLGWRSAEDSVFLVVKQFLEKHKVQVILSEYLDFSVPFFQMSQKLGIRFFAHAHGGDVSVQLRNPKWQTEYLLYNQADGVITVSEASRQKLITLGLEASRVHVIPCGVDVPEKPVVKTEREMIRCLAVGRMVSKKAPILLLDAFRRAVAVCPNLRLDYVGTGLLLPAIRQFIKAFNLVDKVRLHGGQSHNVVCQLMEAADIFLQHSMTDPDTGDQEGLPVAILEAMGYSLPVVSTRHAGIPEAVVDRETGFIVDEGDSVDMAQKIVLFVQDFDLRVQMGLAGWQRARELFSWKQEKGKLLEIMNLAR